MRLRRVDRILLIIALLLTTLSPLTGSADVCPPHPYPCGDEWPAGLEGPFALKGGEPENVFVKVPKDYDHPENGTINLEGWIGVPDLPDGVGAPVVLHSTPYLRSTTASPFSFSAKVGPEYAFWWKDPTKYDPLLPWGGVSPMDLVKRGYAAAYFAVRGTASSGGCIDMFGKTEQRDQEFLVNWLGKQSWSNGRVGMGGVSYPAGTAFEAAVSGQSHLKTVVISGVVSDVYTLYSTPQGAIRTLYPLDFPLRLAEVSLLPPAAGIVIGPETPVVGFPPGEASATGWLEGSQYAIHGWASTVPERACQSSAGLLAAPLAQLTDHRDDAFFSERQLINDAANVTASILLAHGFLESAAHNFQESALWGAISSPKRQVEGRWGHTFPTRDDGYSKHPEISLDASWENDTWSDLLFNWFDYWLKGRGTPEHLGKVDYQDTTGAWRQSDAWPPSNAHEEALYLSGETLRGLPANGARSFRSAPDALNSYHNARQPTTLAGGLPQLPYQPWRALCAADTTSAGLVYRTEPITQRVVIAGNPYAYFNLESDLPGGIVTLNLLDLAPEFTCDDTYQPKAFREISSGAADLRFHRGNFDGIDFPVGTPTHVRVDLWDLAEVLEPGHRLALVVSYGDGVAGWTNLGTPYFPTLTVHADASVESSHLVIPVLDGSTLGGEPSGISYPPRPFVPSPLDSRGE